MKKLICSFALLSAFTAANAAILVFNPTMDNDDSTADVNLKITVTDTMTGVDILAEVLPTMALPNLADIRGLFFNLDVAGVCADVSGDDLTSCETNSDGQKDWSINPLGSFTLALQIGTAGAGKDDIQKATLSVKGLTAANFTQAAGRLTSVGELGDRTNSSKLKPVAGFDPSGGGDEVPEPSTMALIGLGLVGVVSRLRRK